METFNQFRSWKYQWFAEFIQKQKYLPTDLIFINIADSSVICECSECKFKAVWLSFIEKHVKLHDKLLKYACIGCGRRYLELYQQKRHMERCGFNRENKLQKQSSHNQNELDGYKYCNECKFKTLFLSTLEKHKMLHDT